MSLHKNIQVKAMTDDGSTIQRIHRHPCHFLSDSDPVKQLNISNSLHPKPYCPAVTFEPGIGGKMKVENEGKKILHLEVAVHPGCPTPVASLQIQWAGFVESRPSLKILEDSEEIDKSCLPSELLVSCLRASVCFNDDEELPTKMNEIQVDAFEIQVYVFRLSFEETCTEEIEPDGGDSDWTAGCDSLSLPHSSLDGLWDSLILEPGIKQRLLNYAQSALLFSDRSVSPHLVHWNRILLLHGVPGTGKTSLSRSLAHKLAIRMNHRFPSATLLDIRAHSLFSKWFSTSGKLVSSLFQMVRDMLQDDPTNLVFVLVDEVESLASSRGNNNGGDPSDAMRAVNSLLTSLDKLRSFPNVLVLATTNLTDSVDAAFVDRVDLKVHVGLPILKARYEILRSCVQHLQSVKIVENTNTSMLASFEQQCHCNGDSNTSTKLLLECAKKAEGFSGRSLRRLPLQAHAHFLGGRNAVSVDRFLEALSESIEFEQSSRDAMIG